MEDSSGSIIGALFMGVIYLAVMVCALIGMWKVFSKAGKPGWAILVPIYNLIVLLEIARRPTWWIILMLLPVINLVTLIILGIDIAKSFGKGTGFGLGLTFLGFAFYPILGFGGATYQPVTR